MFPHHPTSIAHSNTMQVILYLILLLLNSVFHIGLVIENTTRVPVGDDLSYNEWFPKRI